MNWDWDWCISMSTCKTDGGTRCVDREPGSGLRDDLGVGRRLQREGTHVPVWLIHAAAGQKRTQHHKATTPGEKKMKPWN